MPNPIMLSLSPDGSIATLPVSITWSEINGLIDKFSFEESDLRKSDASKELQRLNPLVGK